jgi:hypothetical protein
MSLVRIGGPPPLPSYLMDLAMSEEFSFPGEATKFPVEQGVEFTDHIRELPDEITLECIVSDTPIGAVATDPSRQPVTGPDGTISTALPSAEALQRMRELKAARQPVRIETTLGVFTSMAFIDLSTTINKDKSPGRSTPGVTEPGAERPATVQPGALFFTAKFRKSVLVTNKRTKVRVRTNLPGAGRVRTITVKRVDVVHTFQWKHGDPPGAAWHIPNLIEPVTAIYTPSNQGLAPADHAVLIRDAVAFDSAGFGASPSGVVQYVDAVGQEITGERLRALRADLRRDQAELNQRVLSDQRFAKGPLVGPKPFKFDQPIKKNLPPSMDISKWNLPPSFGVP